jgi:hypothetical protein
MEAYYQPALLHLRKNEPNAAIAMYRQTAALRIRSADLSGPFRAYIGRNTTEAESVYRKLIDIDSTEALGWTGTVKLS